MRRLGLSFFALAFLAFSFADFASAIDRSWDDAGGSAGKLWGDFGEWNPDGAVGADNIFIGDLAAALNDTTLVDAAYGINALTITNGADVVNSTDSGATNDFRLLVNGTTTVSGAGSSILIFGADNEGLDTNTLIINSGALVQLNSQSVSGTAVLQVDGGTGSGLLDINAGATLSGNGLIEINDAPAAVTGLLVNDGTLTATHIGIAIGTPATTLQITATNANARVDLDGPSGAGVVNVNTNATLDINVQLFDGFTSDLNLSAGATLNIQNAWSIDGGTVDVNTPGIIVGTGGPAAHLAGGAITFSAGTLTLNDNLDALVIDAAITVSAGIIENSGSITFNSTSTLNAADDLHMNGNASSLIVNAVVNIGGAAVAVGEDFNWDGNGLLTNQTTVNAAGDLNINVENIDAGADDTFNGTLNMNSGDVDVQVGDGAWTMAGQLNMSNTAANIPTLSGDAITFTGNVDVAGTGTSLINAVVTMSGAPSVDVAAGATLRFTGASLTTNSVAFTGAGTIQLDSTLTTVAALTVNMPAGIVDLDGNTLLGDRILVTGAFALNVAAIDTSGDVFDNEEIEISSTGQLAVNLTNAADSWVMDGLFDLNGPGGAVFNTHLAGSNIELRGTTDVNGNSRTNARVDITGAVNIAAASNFALSGGNTVDNLNRIEGGVVNGPGVFSSDTGSSLSGHGTINAGVDFNGSADLFADDGTLTLNGGIGDANVLGAFADGILNVTNAWNTNTVGAVSLFGGQLTGALITNDGGLGIGGNGLLASRVINNSRIQAHSGGTLIVETAANTNDWDGDGTGELNAVSADLELRDNAVFLFGGTVSASNGHSVFANGFHLQFAATSTLNLTSGTYRSTNATDLAGTVNVGAGDSTLQVNVQADFQNTSNTTLTGNLRLDNATRINAGATFAGGGQLINLAGRTLTIVDGANVDVALRNEGTLALGLSPGQTQGLDFQQTATGIWAVEIGGTNAVTDFDRMTLAGVAQLGGTLDLALIDGFQATIALGNSFNILSAAGGVSGTFASILQPPTMPMALMFNVNYSIPNIVQLLVVSAAMPDVNMDGVVNIFDINLVSSNWGTAGPAGDANKDGIVNIFDINLISANWGPVPGSATAVPEPATWAMLLAAAAIGVPVLMRKRRVR